MTTSVVTLALLFLLGLYYQLRLVWAVLVVPLIGPIGFDGPSEVVAVDHRAPYSTGGVSNSDARASECGSPTLFGLDVDCELRVTPVESIDVESMACAGSAAKEFSFADFFAAFGEMG